MARKIIVLDVAKMANGDFAVECVFWLTAPANRIIKRPGAVSAVPDATTGAGSETEAIQLGTIVEQVNGSGQFASGTTIASAKAQLVTLYNAAQAALTATAIATNLILDAWDGTGWTV